MKFPVPVLLLLLLTVAASLVVPCASSDARNGAERGPPAPLTPADLSKALEAIAGGLSPEDIFKAIVDATAGPNNGNPRGSPASWFSRKVLDQLTNAVQTIRGLRGAGTELDIVKLSEILSGIIAQGVSNDGLAGGIADASFLSDVLQKIANAAAALADATNGTAAGGKPRELTLKDITEGIVGIVEYERAIQKEFEASKTPAAGCGKHLMTLSPCYGPLMNPPTANSSLDKSRCCKAAVEVLSGAGGGGSCICHLLRDPLLLGFPFSTSNIGKLFHACPVLQGSSNTAALRNFDFNKTCRGSARELPPLVMYAANRSSDESPSPAPVGPSQLPRKVLPQGSQSSGKAWVMALLVFLGCVIFLLLVLFLSWFHKKNCV